MCVQKLHWTYRVYSTQKHKLAFNNFNLDACSFQLTVPWLMHEMSRYGLAVLSELISGQQRVYAVVDVRGTVQL